MDREKVIIRTSIFGIIANAILVLAKAFIGILANSVAIIMDAVNNLTDAFSSIITIIGTKLANKRPDKKHPFGYGRIEYITSTVISMIILFAGFTAIYESVLSIIDHFKYGTMPDFKYYTIIIVSIAILIKIIIGIYFQIKGKQADSDNLKASGMDALFDSLLSFATLISIIFALVFDLYIEGYLGILIGLFIIKSGAGSLKESLSLMIGERFDSEVVNNLKKDIKKIEGVYGAYDVIINSYGPNKNIGSLHIEVQDTLSAYQIQDIEKKISRLAYDKYNIILTVGIYAVNTQDNEINDMIQYLKNIIKDYPTIVQMHGFYLDKKELVCSFDLVFLFDDKEPIKSINEIKEKLKEKYSKYNFYVQFDQDFSLT